MAKRIDGFTGFADDPAGFCREVLGAEPYDRQIEMMEAVRDHEQVSVAGANASGKDWTVGRVICWWQETHIPAKTIITGPTARQVTDIVWREVRMAYHAARRPLGGRMMAVEARWEHGDNHFALGFSTDRPWNLQGFHSENLLVIVTEAHGFSDDDLVALKRLMPKRLLLTGNPLSGMGEFYASHHGKRDLYHAISISALDSPNVREDSERIAGLVTRRDIERMRRDWGQDSALYRATVLAEFAGLEDGLYPLAWLREAAELRPESHGPVVAGLDVAGPGEDETVLVVRAGPNIIATYAWRNDDPRGEVLAALRQHPEVERVNVDVVGIGYYLARHLRDAGVKVVAVNAGVAARDRTRFANKKAELYWALRERLKDGDLGGLTDQTAIAQLAGVRYRHNARGQVEIESKDLARRRGVKSPDRAEAVIFAFGATKASGVQLGSDADISYKPPAAGLWGKEY